MKKKDEIEYVCCGLCSHPNEIEKANNDPNYIKKESKGGEVHELCGWSCTPVPKIDPYDRIKDLKKQVSELQSALSNERRLRDRDRLNHDLQSDDLRNQVKELTEFIKENKI